MKRFFVTLLIILLLGVGGYTGWYFWNKNKTETKTLGTQQTANDPTEGGKYLVIKEWGVRFKPDNLIKNDLYYGLSKSEDFITGTPNEVAVFASKKLDQIVGNNCKLTKDSNGTGFTGGSGNMLVRIKVEDARSSNDVPYALKQSDYWYYPLGSKGSCLPNQQNGQLESDITQSIIKSLKTLEVYKS